MGSVHAILVSDDAGHVQHLVPVPFPAPFEPPPSSMPRGNIEDIRRLWGEASALETTDGLRDDVLSRASRTLRRLRWLLSSFAWDPADTLRAMWIAVAVLVVIATAAAVALRLGSFA